jgi:hypothetical protein
MLGVKRTGGLLRQGSHLLRYLGPGWLAYRMKYALWLRTGRFQRRLPARTWAEQPLADFLHDPKLASPEFYAAYRAESGTRFFFGCRDRQGLREYFSRWDVVNNPVQTAESLREGILTYFEHTPVQVGFPPDWHTNPFTGQRAPKEYHWSGIDDFGFGDIKVIWETNRFGFTYALVRAYWRTADERYAEWFWQLVEDWHAKNPPQLGPNWKCGQEIAFRVMAWVFGLYGFEGARASTPERVATLAQMIALSGHRIAANLDYALSQNNNHGISEAVGIWTIGMIFPELRGASRWRRLARQILERLGRELIYNDGTFSQHSVNYQRLMLHAYLWAMRLGDLNGEPFSPALFERIHRAARFLYDIQDEVTGAVPYYGSNDGALILPLSNCCSHDYRPVVQAINYLKTGARCYQDGPWDEDLVWIFGPAAPEAPVRAPARKDLQAPDGGYYTLRSASGFAFTRCGTYRHRPGQADMLHLDVWWQGQNIALDAGTYSYNAPAPWDDSLGRTTYHNTISVDDCDQMDRCGRFLWLPWVRGQVLVYQRSRNGTLAYWEGSHNGYDRLKWPVVYRRGVVSFGDLGWLVLDALDSAGPHRYRLHWLLADHPYEWDSLNRRLVLNTPSGAYGVQVGALGGSGEIALHRAEEATPVGWRAPYYQYREPALALESISHGPSVRFWSLLGPYPFRGHPAGDSFRIASEFGNAEIEFQNEGQRPLVRSITLFGSRKDHLRLD